MGKIKGNHAGRVLVEQQAARSTFLVRGRTLRRAHTSRYTPHTSLHIPHPFQKSSAIREFDHLIKDDGIHRDWIYSLNARRRRNQSFPVDAVSALGGGCVDLRRPPSGGLGSVTPLAGAVRSRAIKRAVCRSRDVRVCLR